MMCQFVAGLPYFLTLGGAVLSLNAIKKVSLQYFEERVLPLLLIS